MADTNHLSRNAFTTIACVMFCGGSLANENVEKRAFLCVEEMSTGFVINDSGLGWRNAKFSADAKYLVRPLNDGEKSSYPDNKLVEYGVFEFGSDYPKYNCHNGFSYSFADSVFPTSIMNCEGIGTFVMSNETLRFIYTYTAGFINSEKGEVQKDGSTPYISLGSCSPL